MSLSLLANQAAPKAHTGVYTCSRCRQRAAAFRLFCPECGAWNSLAKEKPEQPPPPRPVSVAEAVCTGPLRRTTRIRELDMLLGDGLVPGSLLLLSGPPGAGKSTLVMGILKRMDARALYVSGEESIQQMKMRADRLRIRSHRIFLLFETDMKNIASALTIRTVDILVIDSIQSVSLEGYPGSTAQVRYCTSLLRSLSQSHGVSVIIISQMTKDNRTAGPRYLEHTVDVVLSLSVEGERSGRRRLVAQKNRFGSTTLECGLVMRKQGLVWTHCREA